MRTHSSMYGRESEAQRQSPCKDTVHLSAVAVIPNPGDSWRGKKGKKVKQVVCKGRSPPPLSQLCVQTPFPGWWVQSSGPALKGRATQVTFPGSWEMPGHTPVTAWSTPCTRTGCKLAQSIIFFGHALTWGSHSQGIMAAKNSPGHKPAHSSKD